MAERKAIVCKSCACVFVCDVGSECDRTTLCEHCYKKQDTYFNNMNIR